MARLGDVLGAVMTQIDRGRSQADVATLEIAQAYKDHPLLSEFPIPHLSLDEVVVDLKVSISEAPMSPKRLLAESKAQIVAQVERLVTELPAQEPALRALTEGAPELPNVWATMARQAVERVARLLPADAEIEPEGIAEGAATLVGAQLSNAVLAPAAKVRAPAARTFLEKEAPAIEKGLAARILEIIKEALKGQPVEKERLNVLVTASELQSIPSDRITTLHLTLRESDRVWTKIEMDDRTIKEKLIPS